VDNVNAMHSILVGKGFQSGVDLRTVVAAGHQHNESYWAQRCPDMLRFLIGPPSVAAVGPPHAERLSFSVRPNPVRSRARFEFSLAAAAHTRLDLFDVTGRHLRSLIDTRLEAGPHSASWDGRLEDGPTPAGVYMARLDVGGITVVRRIVALGDR
jgi:hypothetical protein